MAKQTQTTATPASGITFVKVDADNFTAMNGDVEVGHIRSYDRETDAGVQTFWHACYLGKNAFRLPSQAAARESIQTRAGFAPTIKAPTQAAAPKEGKKAVAVKKAAPKPPTPNGSKLSVVAAKAAKAKATETAEA